MSTFQTMYMALIAADAAMRTGVGMEEAHALVIEARAAAKAQDQRRNDASSRRQLGLKPRRGARTA